MKFIRITFGYNSVINGIVKIVFNCYVYNDNGLTRICRYFDVGVYVSNQKASFNFQ